MLKNRLAKLEQSMNQKQVENKIYLVYQDENRDRMSIPDLNYLGTIENGRLLMAQYPNGMFVIWCSMVIDKDYSDDEWNRMVKDFAN